MLQVNEIRENKEKFITALTKRGFDATQLFEEVLQADETRKTTQTKLDDTLSQSNTFSKEIGILYKNGEAQKANLLKEKTGQLKELSKELSETLNNATSRLQELLFTIPNIPHESVPAGTDENVMKPFLVKGRFLHFLIMRSHIGSWQKSMTSSILN